MLRGGSAKRSEEVRATVPLWSGFWRDCRPGCRWRAAISTATLPDVSEAMDAVAE